MSWTYSGDPQSSAREAVRFLVSDTDISDQLAQDEEINFSLSEEGDSIYRAAATTARAIAAKFTRQTSLQDRESGVFFETKEKADHYLTLAETLLKRAQRAGVIPFSGGLFVADKETRQSDPDEVQPAFTRELHNIHLPAGLDLGRNR